MSLASLLPKPMHAKSKWDDDESDEDDNDVRTVALTAKAPPYGRRKGFVPRELADYGDGGAYPEIMVAQFPLDMGRKDGPKAGTILPITLDAKGKVQYDQILRQGQSKDKIIHSTYDSLVPVQITGDDPKRELPSEAEIKKATEKT